MIKIVMAGALVFLSTNVFAGQRLGSPYLKSGVVNCSLPGTVAEFQLTGRGMAKLIRSNTNYVGFGAAMKKKHWSASILAKPTYDLLILDNGASSRIMVTIPGGQGMAFTADGGVSDILCQILVSP